MHLEYYTKLILLKDITLFYHIQSEYKRLEEDIEWEMFNLPYWDYLGPHDSTAEDKLIQQACLTIIITGAAAHGGNICAAFGDKISECLTKVQSFQYGDSFLERLRNHASMLLGIALSSESEQDFNALFDFERQTIYDQCVRCYFLGRLSPS